MTDWTLLNSYINEIRKEPLGTIVRFFLCPFCGHRIKAKGFVVSRTNKGILCWCHRCHSSRRIGGSTPSVRDCLRIADELKAKKIQHLCKHAPFTEPVHWKKECYSVSLPQDVTCEIPAVAMRWLRRYHVTQQEIQRNGICWSPAYSRLIFPVRDVNYNLIYWQGRYFGSEPEKNAKYYNVSTSRSNVWFDIGNKDSSFIVLVEDILSAIAVNRMKDYRAIALLGCYLNENLILKLQSKNKQVIVWLDSDKVHQAWRYCKRLNVFGVKATTIYTRKDPKEYTNQDIARILSGRKE